MKKNVWIEILTGLIIFSLSGCGKSTDSSKLSSSINHQSESKSSIKTILTSSVEGEEDAESEGEESGSESEAPKTKEEKLEYEATHVKMSEADYKKFQDGNYDKQTSKEADEKFRELWRSASYVDDIESMSFGSELGDVDDRTKSSFTAEIWLSDESDSLNDAAKQQLVDQVVRDLAKAFASVNLKGNPYYSSLLWIKIHNTEDNTDDDEFIYNDIIDVYKTVASN